MVLPGTCALDITQSGVSASTASAGGAHGSIVPDFERRRLIRFARVSADFIAIRVKWALRKCVARRIRSSSVRMQSGSAWRSNVDMKASLAALVMSWGSLWECATCAPRRPLSACEILGDCAVRSDGFNAVASLATPHSWVAVHPVGQDGVVLPSPAFPPARSLVGADLYTLSPRE